MVTMSQVIRPAASASGTETYLPKYASRGEQARRGSWMGGTGSISGTKTRPLERRAHAPPLLDLAPVQAAQAGDAVDPPPRLLGQLDGPAQQFPALRGHLHPRQVQG